MTNRWEDDDYYDDSVTVAMQFNPALSQFAHWLSTHAGTVRSIEFDIKWFMVGRWYDLSTLEEILHDLAVALRAAGQGMAIAEPCSSACSVAASAMLMRPLKLQSFTCCYVMTSPLLVSALPAATLTRLKMEVLGEVQVHRELSSLSNLRSLYLTRVDNGPAQTLSCGYLSSINQLSRLIDLTLFSTPSTWELNVLPQHLSKLNLCIIRAEDKRACLTLSHLTALQQLAAEVECDIEAVSLPVQLQTLHIHYPSAVYNMLALDIGSMQQLTQLLIGHSQDSREELILLKQLQLSEIKLGYNTSMSAVAAAPAWLQLQQLSLLELCLKGSAVQMASVMNACCQLTSLTQLIWELTLVTDEAANAATAQDAMARISVVCHSLKRLTNLRRLELDLGNWVEVQQDDMLHLSSLIGLTYLWLRVDNLGRSDCTLAMLLQLTQLQDLSLAGVKEIEVLSVVGQLKQLTGLDLLELPKEVEKQGLKYLTGLCNLQELMGFDSCSKKVMKQFWADLRA